MKIELPKKAEYLEAADSVRAINPAHQSDVRNWARAMRLVDLNVDCAAICEDFDGDAAWRKQEMHLAAEERHWDRAHEIAYTLPKRELANAAKQLMAACNGGTAAA